MKSDKEVIEYLNKALRHEFTAVNQYWLHDRLLDNWGYKVLAKTWRKESIEEMQHADKLIQRIIFLDGSPNMQTLESLHIGKTVKAVLDSDLQAELSAHSLYAEARRAPGRVAPGCPATGPARLAQGRGDPRGRDAAGDGRHVTPADRAADL